MEKIGGFFHGVENIFPWCGKIPEKFSIVWKTSGGRRPSVVASKHGMKFKGTRTQAPGQAAHIILYDAADGKVAVKVVFARETFWLTQKLLADMFGIKVAAVNKQMPSPTT